MKKNIVKITTILFSLFFSLSIANIGNCKTTKNTKNINNIYKKKLNIKQKHNILRDKQKHIRDKQKHNILRVRDRDFNLIKIANLVKELMEYEKYKFNKFQISTLHGFDISSFIGIRNTPIYNFNRSFQFKYYLNKNFFIKPELGYSKEGGNIKIKDKDVTNNRKIINEYINIPFTFGYTFKNAGVSLELGPQFNFSITNNTIQDIKTLKDLNPFGVSFLLGTEFAVGKYIHIPSLSIIGRYKIGLTKVYSSKKEFNSNSVFQIGILYKFL